MYVSDLTIYPIKSLPGVRLGTALATPWGLSTVNGIIRDRSYMIVRKSDGKFITLRGTCSKELCGIEIEYDPPELLTSRRVDASRSCLILRASHDARGSAIEPLRLPAVSDTPEDLEVTVWDWRGSAQVVTHASEWISRVLGVESHIVRCDPDTHRRDVDPAWVNRDTHAKVMFADGFPYLFVFEESLHALNHYIIDHGHEPIEMKRFRGNICVAGGTPWQEDCMRRVSLHAGDDTGSNRTEGMFDMVKPCSRCAIPTVDPRTGQKNDHVREALTAMRKGTALGWETPASFKHSTFFGINACLVPEGDDCDDIADDSWAPQQTLVAVGDQVTVLRAATGPFLMKSG